MSADTRQIFATIDKQDTDAFVAYLSEDVKFQFGNADPVFGRDAVRDAVNGFFSSIGSLTHHVRDIWDVESDVTVCMIDVEYVRHDGEVVYLPNIDVLIWRDGLVADWKIVIDITPIYAPIEQASAAVRTLAPQPA